MARPNKQGVDYFPLDVHLDDKFKFIEIKYKLEGFAIIMKLMQKIYSYGYWYKWTDDEALLFSDELRADYNTVKGVVDEALERGVFNKEMYEKHNILTSTGIQKRYKEIVRRRKDVEVIEDYLLIDDIVTTSSKQNDDTMTSPSEHDDSKSTQTESKQKKKVKESKRYTEQFETFWNDYPRKLDKKQAFTKFKAALKRNSFEDILEGTKGYVNQIEKDKTEKQFIKHATTFLNNDSYLDFVSSGEKQESFKLKEPTIDEQIKELDSFIKLGRDYHAMTQPPEYFDGLLEERERLEQLRANQGEG